MAIFARGPQRSPWATFLASRNELFHSSRLWTLLGRRWSLVTGNFFTTRSSCPCSFDFCAVTNKRFGKKGIKQHSNLHQALGTHPHVGLLRTPPNYHYLDCILARSEGRHLPDIAYYMKGGINRNESEGEPATWEGKQVVAGYRRRSPITR